MIIKIKKYSDIERVISILEEYVSNNYYKYKYDIETFKEYINMNIIFIETKRSHCLPNLYFDMIESIMYDNNLKNIGTVEI